MILALKFLTRMFQKIKFWVNSGHVTSYKGKKRPNLILKSVQSQKIVETSENFVKLELLTEFTNKNRQKI